MKWLSGNVSPFLLLLIPFFAAVFFAVTLSDSSAVQQRAQLSTSFMSFPDLSAITQCLGW